MILRLPRYRHLCSAATVHSPVQPPPPLATALPPRTRVAWCNLPPPVPYGVAWRWQQELVARRIAAGAPPLPDVVLCLEHSHVYTLGRAASEAHLRFAPGGGPLDAEIHRVERGGKVTYHGPGQLVVYPVLQLERYRKDLHWYVTCIEEVVIRSLGAFGLPAARHAGYPGVWIGEAKVAQVGMSCSKWVTMHGFAVNVCPDLAYFDHIVPCGIEDKEVTSVAAQLGRHVGVGEMRAAVAASFAHVFDVELDVVEGDEVDPLSVSLGGPRLDVLAER